MCVGGDSASTQSNSPVSYKHVKCTLNATRSLITCLRPDSELDQHRFHELKSNLTQNQLQKELQSKRLNVHT